jgi:hypothetical protein
MGHGYILVGSFRLQSDALVIEWKEDKEVVGQQMFRLSGTQLIQDGDAPTGQTVTISDEKFRLPTALKLGIDK